MPPARSLIDGSRLPTEHPQVNKPAASPCHNILRGGPDLRERALSRQKSIEKYYVEIKLNKIIDISIYIDVGHNRFVSKSAIILTFS